MTPELKAIDVSSGDEEQENPSSDEGDDTNLMDGAFVLEDDGETRYSDNDVGNGWNFMAALRKIREEDPVRAGTGALLDAHIAEKRLELLAKNKCRINESDKKGVDISSGHNQSDDEPGDAPIGPDDLKDLQLRNSKTGKPRNSSIAAGASLNDGDNTNSSIKEADEAMLKKANFFSNEVSSGSLRPSTFQGLNLSRPFLRACDKLGYVTPTAVQADCIPHGLAGKDICASATTGSGKTAAFLLPALERLLFRPKRISAMRVLVITPTRELAVQIHSMCTSLTQFTDIQSCLILGGSKNSKSQEAELRSQPDVVVCTPGRMVDHIRNSSGVHCDNVEILILDEADKLLELGFEDEVRFLIDSCPRGRQTMLYSATMNTDVETLATVSFSSRPIRIEATTPNTVADRLIQEFIRVRTSRESDREAMLLSLLSRSFKTKVIVFFDTKVLAHRMLIILGLAGISASELHGNLTVSQRLEALDRFKEGKVAVLAATDVASRGLDICGVHTVINFEMPRTEDIYIHRVGRTARAGCGGRAITLVGEAKRIVMKGILRQHEIVNATRKIQGDPGNTEHASSLNSIQSRSIPQAVIDHYKVKILDMEPEVKEILKQEHIDRQLMKADMEATRAGNIISHENEIYRRPAREWIVSSKRKDQVKQQMSKDSAVQVSGSTILDEENGEQNQVKEKMKDDNTARASDGANDRLGLRKKELQHRMTRKKRRRLENARDLESENQLEVDAPAGGSKKKELSENAFIKKSKKNEISARLKKNDVPIGKSSGIRRKIEIGNTFEMGRGPEKKKMLLNSKKKLPIPPTSSFKEFDPTKFLRKGGKLGNKKFKSRKKHKRR